MLEIECHFECKVINKKYFYILKDLFDGSKKHFYLSDCLNEFENKKINEIKNTDFKIVTWSFQVKKIIFFLDKKMPSIQELNENLQKVNQLLIRINNLWICFY